MDNRPIGIFDSGVGGLTVAAAVMKKLPHEEIIYFGDTARVPYGSKSKETITKFSRQIMDYMLRRNVKMVIIACNTSSSNSYDLLTAMYRLPIQEVIMPGVRACLAATRSNKVGVIATEATIRSGEYERRLRAARPGIEVYSKACPLFVPLVEEGWTSNQVAELTAREYLGDILERGIDSLLLGCTHYPLLYGCIQKVAGPGVNIVNPAETAAETAAEFLDASGMRRVSASAPQYAFYVSDDTSKFKRTCQLVMGTPYNAVKIELA
ncbi:MAG: glutamate racemase [Clostridiales bacterium]|jgi:glutamate racemase|nr:glutamate racemase [Clostridiales bacterium]